MLIFKRFVIKGDFLKNAVLLVSGAGLSQLIPLLFSPVLTRVYSPEDFGRLAFYMACCSIFSIVTTGLYEMAIMLPKYDRNAFSILALICILSFAVCSVMFLVLIGLLEFTNIFSNSTIPAEYYITLPAGIFFTGAFQAITYWLNRKRQYKLMNISKLLQSSVTVILSIALGFMGYTVYGMLIGFVLGTMVSLFPLVNVLISRRNIIKLSDIKSMALAYIKYPKLMMPSSFMNTTATLAPVFFFNKFFSSVIVGGYSFASRILTAPVGIVSTAVGQIYFKNVSALVHTENSIIMPSFAKTGKVLLALSFLLFTPFFFYGQELFVVIFGDKWNEAGLYVEILSIAVFVRFIVSPLSTVFHATGNHKSLAMWQATYFCSTIVTLFFCRRCDFVNLMWIYVLHEALLYTYYLILMVISIKKYDSVIKMRLV